MRSRVSIALLDRGRQRLDEMDAVQAAGQLVVTRQEGEPLLPLVPLVDDADDAMRPHRPPVRPGVPAAEILDPQPLAVMRALGMERVLDAVAAVAVVASA